MPPHRAGRRRRWRAVTPVILGLLTAILVPARHPAEAQVSVPGSADPLRLQEAPRTAPEPRPAGPAVRLDAPVSPPPSGSDEIRLTLGRIVLEGGTVYETAALEPIWAPLLGREVALADVYGVAAAITTRYRNDGYVLSRAIVPAQRIEGGVVRIRIVEGHVGRVTFTGTVSRPSLLQAYADRIVAMRPLQVRTLERYLLLLDDLPGASVTSVLAPLDGEPGAAELTIEMSQRQAEGFGTLDNRGTRYIGPFQATVGGRLTAVLGLYEMTQLRLINTPTGFDELRAYDVSHALPLDSDGTLLTLGINQAFAHPGFTLRALRVSSAATVANATISHPLVRQRAENLILSGGVTLTDLRTDLFAGSQTLLSDRIRTLQVGGLYDFVDTWSGINVIALQLSHGLDMLDGRQTGSPNLSRANGRSDFTKLTGDLQRVQSLGGNWSLLAAVTAQHGFSSLLASEQLGLGGVNFVRAYDPGELTGDRGIAGKLELQYGERPDLPWLSGYQLYGYYDAGRVWNYQALNAERPAASATAAGGGARLTVTDQLAAGVELGKPLTRAVATQGNRDPRVFFSLQMRF